MDAMIRVVRHASDIGVKHLTVYAFSTENWKRSVGEVAGIFDLLLIYVNRELEELHRNGVRVDILGDRTPFSKKVNAALDKTIQKTKDNDGLRFHIALNYGGRADILMAAKDFAMTFAEGHLEKSLKDFDERDFARYLYTDGTPDPDLLIRPGGEKRLSNFLLWQIAYAELIFSDVLWPDFGPEDLDLAIGEYGARKRRFGGRI